MLGGATMDNLHYRNLAEGKITMYGNSVKIEENIAGLTDKQKREMHEERLMHQHYKHKPPERQKGDIKTFSKKARLRLLKRLNRFDFKNKGMPYFVTLTYPKRYPKDRQVYKGDLDVFFKRLKRKFGKLEYIWRLEAQKRGAPHYHLVLYFEDEPDIETLKKWVSRNWYEVVQRLWEEKDEKHLRAGTNCKDVDNFRQMISYVSKYMAKVEGQDSLLNQGRYWGASKNWDDELASEKLKGRKYIKFLRVLRRYLERTNKKLAKKVYKCQNLELFLPRELIMMAYLWAKDGEEMMAQSKPLLPG